MKYATIEEMITCPSCDGKGFLIFVEDDEHMYMPHCWDCGGAGKIRQIRIHYRVNKPKDLGGLHEV